MCMCVCMYSACVHVCMYVRVYVYTVIGFIVYLKFHLFIFYHASNFPFPLSSLYILWHRVTKKYIPICRTNNRNPKPLWRCKFDSLPERWHYGPPSWKWVRISEQKATISGPERYAEVNGRKALFYNVHLIDSEVPDN